MISIGTAVAFWIFIIEPLLDLVFGTYAYRKFKFWFDINFTKKFAELSPWMVKRSKKAAEYYKNTTDKYQKRQLHEWDRIQKKYNY